MPNNDAQLEAARQMQIFETKLEEARGFLKQGKYGMAAISLLAARSLVVTVGRMITDGTVSLSDEGIAKFQEAIDEVKELSEEVRQKGAKSRGSGGADPRFKLLGKPLELGIASAKVGRWIKADGTVQDVIPEKGKKFSIEELQKMVGGYVARFKVPGGLVMIVNEDGQPLNLPPNHRASEIAGGPIVGDVVVLPRGMGW